MTITCPCCHAIVSLETMAQDESARELLALRGQVGAAVWPHLVAYLGLFRSKSRALAWTRALRLAQEVVALDVGTARLAAALAETVETIRAKRDAGDVRPLKNHNYLKRVLESVESVPAVAAPAGSGSLNESAPRERRPAGKFARAEEALADWAGENWLRVEIAHGLLALLAKRLGNAPEVDAIDRTASIWRHELYQAGVRLEEVDRPRVKEGFSRLLSAVEQWWPQPAALLAEMPKRPDRQRLQEPPPTEEQINEGKQRLAEIRRNLAGGMTPPETGG